MKTIRVAAGAGLAVSIMLTPWLVMFFARRGFGQEIRAEGPASHRSKRGTPTMGGVAILAAMWVGFVAARLVAGEPDGGPSALAWLVLSTGLGVVGFLDDLIKLRRQRNLGLSKTAKLVGQLLATITFAVLGLRFANTEGVIPASVRPSFVRDIAALRSAPWGSCWLLTC